MFDMYVLVALQITTFTDWTRFVNRVRFLEMLRDSSCVVNYCIFFECLI